MSPINQTDHYQHKVPLMLIADVILPLVVHHLLTLTTRVQMLLAAVFLKIFSKVKWQYYQLTSARDLLTICKLNTH